MDTGTLLSTALVALALFGLPLLALAFSWRRGGTTPPTAESAPRPARAAARPGYRTWHL